MKLLNRSMISLSISILAIVTVWAAIFYWSITKEIKSSIDEGLQNYKRLIVQNAHVDTTLLDKEYFDKSFFTIQEINHADASRIQDVYLDTVLYMQDFDDTIPELEPVRMLITSFSINDKHYELSVANSMVEKEDLIRTILLNTIGLYIILMAGIIFINNVVLRHLWQPFYNLLHQVKNYKLSTADNYPIIKTKTKEFIDLQHAVNILLRDNKIVFEQQKSFIGNASHELQTPLAIAANKLELILEDENIDNEQAENISEIYQMIQRMIRLNKSLLLLSKIENKQFEENAQVLINDIVKQCMDELEDFASYKELEWHINEVNELTVNINPNLAYIIISNLLRNAIFHNIQNGKINIEIHKDSIIIANTGNESALNKENIFTQFYKSNSKGVGLGLAIVKAILDLYTFKIEYHYKSNFHSFEIIF